MTEIGKPYVFQEALGMLIGTIVTISPFEIVLGPDAVHARNMSGGLTVAMRTGHVDEVHPVPGVVLERHALRYRWPWAHPQTGEFWPVPKPSN